MPSFSAVLLAGGQSIRMGRDKALLSVPDSDTLLWQWQLRTLQALRPEEMFWSGPRRAEINPDIHFVADKVQGAGPLAGIQACLEIMKSDLLVVLAIDLPQMTTSFLESLLKYSSPKCGAVPQRGDFFEPLAATYPKALHPITERNLGQGCYSLQTLIGEGVQEGMLDVIPVREHETYLFKNLNSPSDLA